jgi:hypothetical protein
LKALDDMMSRAFDLKIFAFIFILAFQISAKAADRNKVEELFFMEDLRRAEAYHARRKSSG